MRGEFTGLSGPTNVQGEFDLQIKQGKLILKNLVRTDNKGPEVKNGFDVLEIDEAPGIEHPISSKERALLQEDKNHLESIIIKELISLGFKGFSLTEDLIWHVCSFKGCESEKNLKYRVLKSGVSNEGRDMVYSTDRVKLCPMHLKMFDQDNKV